MAVWPATLPQAFQGGGDYQEQPEKTTLRTEMDSGIIKMRRRMTRSTSSMSGTMMLSGAQAGDFMSFWNDTIKGGSITFTGMLGRSQLNQTYQFSEEPTLSHIGGDTYSLTLKLLVLP